MSENKAQYGFSLGSFLLGLVVGAAAAASGNSQRTAEKG